MTATAVLAPGAVLLLTVGLWFGLHAPRPDCGPPWFPHRVMTPFAMRAGATEPVVLPCSTVLGERSPFGEALTVAGGLSAVGAAALWWLWPKLRRR